jgi:AraC-like DNA-binding protein
MASHSAQLSVVPREFTVSGRVVRALLEALETVGVPRVRVLSVAQLEAEQLEIADLRVPCSVIYRLCELALDVTGNPAFGLHWAEKLNGDTFNPISHLLAHATTLRQAFDSLTQFRRLLTDELTYELVESDSLVFVRCVPSVSASLRTRRLTAEMLLTSVLRLLRSFSVHARPVRVSFDYPAPSYRGEYSRVFEGAECFDQPFSEIVFDRALMNAVSPHKDEDVHSALRSIAEQRVLQLTHRVPYSVRVRDYLVQHQPSGRAEMPTVARSLGMSVRSLRRRMDAEGQTFSSVVNEAQSIVAKNLLRNTPRTIQEIAYELGFADTSSFHRAFRRWTGTTPLVYRADLR